MDTGRKARELYDETDTTIKQKALNDHHTTSNAFYGDLSPVSDKITSHRLRLVVHC